MLFLFSQLQYIHLDILSGDVTNCTIAQSVLTLVPIPPPPILTICRLQFQRIRQKEDKRCIQGTPQQGVGGTGGAGDDTEGVERATDDEGSLLSSWKPCGSAIVHRQIALKTGTMGVWR